MNDLNRDKIARQFSIILREWLTPQQIDEVNRLNTPEIINKSGICHSHDFCDANEAMGEAFRAVIRREADLRSDEDLAIWSNAWRTAKYGMFFPSPEPIDGRNAYDVAVYYSDGARLSPNQFRDWYSTDEEAINDTRSFFASQLKHGVKEIHLNGRMIAVIANTDRA